MIFLVIIFHIAYTSANHHHHKQELKFVNVVYRHGDRTPVQPYPTDPYPASIYPEGLGELTELGKNQMFNVGKYIKSRYPGFRFNEFNENDIYVESSDIDRTKMSAQLVLAGLYHSGDDISTALAKGQPIPVHPIPMAEDNKIIMSASCPKFDRLQKNVIENVKPDVQQKLDALLKDLSQFTGLDLNYSLMGLMGAGLVFDTLSIEEKNGLPLPDWTPKFYPEPLKKIGLFTLYELPFTTTEMNRLRCGPLIKDIIKHFDDVISGKSMLKMWQYSGHDTTITSVLQCLNVFDDIVPPVSSQVYLELYQDKHGRFSVLVSYKRDDVEILKIPGCTEYCPLDRFKELASDIIPGNWRAECNS